MNRTELLNGVTIAFDDVGSGSTTVLLLHGYGCDRTFLAPQATYLVEKGYRVLAPDLRGHGESSAPVGDYTMGLLAKDVERLLDRLGIEKAFIVGHSMGGNVALNLAAETSLSAGLVLIDSLVFASPALLDLLAPVREAIRGSDYKQVYLDTIGGLTSCQDDPTIVADILKRAPLAPQHVLVSCLDAHFAQADFSADARRISTPLAYIGATNPLGNAFELKGAAPQTVLAQTLGSGHFSPLTAPEQINAMISAFIDGVHRCSAPSKSTLPKTC